MKRVAFAIALFTLALAAALPTAADMEDLIRTGDEHYVNRNEGHVGSTLAPGPIAKAIASYEQALAEYPASVEASWKLMRALYFQGTYTDLDDERKKEIFRRCTDLGEGAIAREPDSIDVNFWLAVCWGRFGEVYGKMKAAREGVAEKIRDRAQKVIDLDPAYETAGGYRVLGRLHHQSPRIPLLLSWPSNKVAKKLLEKAVANEPVHPLSKVFYAEVLRDEKEKAKAITVLEDLLDDPVDAADAVTWEDARESALHDLEEWR